MILSKLKQNGTIVLYVATVVAMGLAFLGSVINSRMLSNEHFGNWKYIQNYLLLIGYLVNFGLYQSGCRLIASTNNIAKKTIYKSYLLITSIGGWCVMLLITLIVCFFGQIILNNELKKLVLILFPLFIIHPLGFYFEAIFQSERKLISFSIYKVAPPFLYVIFLLLFKKYSVGNIYLNALFYYSAFFIVYLIFILKDRYHFLRRSIEVKELLAENKAFGIQLYYGSLWNVGTGYLIAILIGFFNINNKDVGYYSLALNFIMPLTFLPSIVGTSYYKSFFTSDIIPKKAIQNVLIASSCLFIITILGINYFISLFLNDSYQKVGQLVQIGAFAAIMHGSGDFLNKFLSAKGYGTFIKKTAIIVGLVQIMTSLILVNYFSATGAMISKSIGSILYFLLLGIFYYSKILLGQRKKFSLI